MIQASPDGIPVALSAWAGCFISGTRELPNGPSGYDATVWHATSGDGFHWEERGEAPSSRRRVCEWDEQSVFTPNILVTEDRYYLFYTSVEMPYSEDALTAIGVAFAESPCRSLDEVRGEIPVLRTGPDPAWDSHRVDDACLVVRNGRFWLYYKGRAERAKPARDQNGACRGRTAPGSLQES